MFAPARPLCARHRSLRGNTHPMLDSADFLADSFHHHYCDQQFHGEIVLTYMEFQLDSGEYCQAQHK